MTNKTMPQSPLFEGLSLEQPSLLTITFPKHDDVATYKDVSLGATLANHDNGLTNEMMAPGFASIGAILEEEEDPDQPTTTSSSSLAKQYGVKVGDYIVGINGVGYRRFPPDFPYETLIDVTLLPHSSSPLPPPLTMNDEEDLISLNEDEKNDDHNNNNDHCAKNEEKDEVEGEDGNDKDDDTDIQAKTTTPTITTTTATTSTTTTMCSTANTKKNNYELLSQVLSGKSGTLYPQLLSKIKQIKSASSSPENPNHPPLILHLERYTWDSRVHSWSRFLSARNGNVPMAMMAMQQHEAWRSEFFPIDLTSPRLQKLLKAHAVSEIDVVSSSSSSSSSTTKSSGNGIAPVVYIDFAKLQSMVSTNANTTATTTSTTFTAVGGASENNKIATTNDVIQAFVIYTETLLNKAPDPRCPKLCQFVDLSGVNIKAGIQPGILKKLYGTFEPNYPETLQKMVLYPVPRIMVRIVDAMLSFVNEHTRKKFIITDDLGLVCKELGWNWKEITEECQGSVNGYMKKHLRHGLSFVLD